MLHWVFCGILIGLLAGCGHTPQNSPSRYKQAQDSPLVHEHYLAKIPDAQPVPEPLSVQGNPESYVINGVRYQIMNSSSGYAESGVASWYGSKFHGYRTSNGEIYNMFSMTAAHKTLPLPTYLSITNTDNGKQVIVRANDRGPFHSDRIVDLSYAAAVKLGYANKGTANVQIEAIDPVTWQQQHRWENLAEGKDLYLQIGAFSSLAAATRVQGRLELELGAVVKVYRDASRQPSLHKVQIGPLQDQPSAAVMQQKIRDMGLGVPLIVRTGL